jgi:general secretion pathway protein J
MALLAAALYGSYFGLVSGRDRATAVAEEVRELRTTLDALRRQIASAYFRKPLPPEDQEHPRFRFVVEDRDFYGKPASTLTFTTIAAPAVGETQPVSDQMLVEYRPVARENGMRVTVRKRDVYMEGETPPAYVQMEDVQGFLVECYDGTKWVRNWDARLNNGLPKQVRVTITLAHGEKSTSYSAIVAPRMVQN